MSDFFFFLVPPTPNSRHPTKRQAATTHVCRFAQRPGGSFGTSKKLKVCWGAYPNLCGGSGAALFDTKVSARAYLIPFGYIIIERRLYDLLWLWRVGDDLYTSPDARLSRVLYMYGSIHDYLSSDELVMSTTASYAYTTRGATITMICLLSRRTRSLRCGLV